MSVTRTALPLAGALKPFVRYCMYKEVSAGGRRLLNRTQADLWPSLFVSLGRPVHRLLPDGRRRALPRVSAMGAAVIPDEFELSDGNRILAFSFFPESAHPFFGPSMEEFTDKIVPLEDFWGSAGRELVRRLEEVRSPREAKELVERELLRRLEARREVPSGVSRALQDALASRGRSSARELAGSADCSLQHLNRLFTRWVGVGPKVFCRVARFQALCSALSPESDPDWADLACAFGYADQSHLIRDCRAYSGMSPARFFDRVIRAESAVWKALQPEGLSFSPN